MAKRQLVELRKEITPYDHSEWVLFKDAEIYLKHGRASTSDYLILSLQVVSFRRAYRRDNVKKDPTKISTGFMNEMMTEIELIAKENNIGVYISNVTNEFLPTWFLKRGYCIVRGSFPSFYRVNFSPWCRSRK